MHDAPAPFEDATPTRPSAEAGGRQRPADAAAEDYGIIGYETADLWLRDPRSLQALPDRASPQDPD